LKFGLKKAANIYPSNAVTKSYAGPINFPETGQDTFLNYFRYKSYE